MEWIRITQLHLQGLSGRTAQRRAPRARPLLPAPPHLRRCLMSRNTLNLQLSHHYHIRLLSLWFPIYEEEVAMKCSINVRCILIFVICYSADLQGHIKTILKYYE